jgi:hypothetical protein
LDARRIASRIRRLIPEGKVNQRPEKKGQKEEKEFVRTSGRKRN